MVYLDYAATDPYVKFTWSQYAEVANPNANYAHQEKKWLKQCEDKIKSAIGAKSGKVLFGGTSTQLMENLFFHISEEHHPDNYLTICSIYEHDSVFRFAQQWGNIESIRHVIETYSGDKQLIVCLMGVNNITGEIFPIEEIGEMCHKHDTFFICDLTAHIGHAPIPKRIDEWCDCAFWSGHKIGTEVGIGCMWLSDKFNDWLNDMNLHGTPNLKGALAISDATERAVEDADYIQYITADLYSYLMDRLGVCNIEYEDANSNSESYYEFTPCINAIQLIGINADALQQYAASKGIYIGIGASSCQAVGDYRILRDGYRLSEKSASEVVRVSFNRYTEYSDIDELVDVICDFKEKFLCE